MLPVNSLGPGHYRCGNCRTRVRIDSPMLDAGRTRCRWVGKARCGNDPAKHQPLCDHHLMVAAQWALKRPDTRQTLIDQYEGDEFDRARSGVWQRARAEIAEGAERARQRRDEIYPPVDVVYYVRLAPDQIKIGTTAYLSHRMLSLRVHDDAQILAVEPGDRKLEKQRHRQFADLRYHAYREDFRPGEELMHHIERVREENGKPFDVVARLLALRDNT